MFHVYDIEADRQLRIRFYRDWPDRKLGKPCPPRYTTVCEIENRDKEEVISIGYAHLRPNDMPNKVIGKKVALTNALILTKEDVGSIEVVHRNFPKHIRTDIWEAFWEWIANWKAERCPNCKTRLIFDDGVLCCDICGFQTEA